MRKQKKCHSEQLTGHRLCEIVLLTPRVPLSDNLDLKQQCRRRLKLRTNWCTELAKHTCRSCTFRKCHRFFSSDVASRCPACERSSVKKGHRLFVISSFSVTFRVTALWAIERQLAMSSRHGFGAAEYTS